MLYFLQGLSMGLAYVAPIGLQNLFVINSALTHTRKRALLTALIIIFFDIALSVTCFFGIGAVMQRFIWLQMLVLLVGSLIVIYIGASLVRAPAEEITHSDTTITLNKTISTAFIVTWINPQAIIDGTMMLGAFRVTLPAEQVLPFITGVMSASFIWFTSLTFIISLFRERFNAQVLRYINIVCGVVIIFYGCKLLYNFVSMI